MRSHSLTWVLPHLGHLLNGCFAIKWHSSHSQLGILKVTYLQPTLAINLSKYSYCFWLKCSDKLRWQAEPPSNSSAANSELWSIILSSILICVSLGLNI